MRDPVVLNRERSAHVEAKDTLPPRHSRHAAPPLIVEDTVDLAAHGRHGSDPGELRAVARD